MARSYEHTTSRLLLGLLVGLLSFARLLDESYSLFIISDLIRFLIVYRTLLSSFLDALAVLIENFFVVRTFDPRLMVLALL